MQGSMHAVVIRAPMDFSLEEVPIPAVPAGGFLLEVAACGLCGSDLRTLRAGHLRVKFPWILGHEICGTFIEAGKDYAGPWKRGDVLAVGPVVYCGTCEFCVAGRFEYCENYAEIAQKWPGGFSEYVAIPAEAVRLGTIRLSPPGLDPAFAAITEPISSCVHAQEKGNVGLGDTVVIIGAGPVGCIHACLARARGAFKVILVDIAKDRLDLAAAFQPEACIDSSKEDPVDAVRRLTNGKGAEVIITANPAPIAPVQAVRMAKKGGRILLFGGLPTQESTPPVDLNLVHYQGLYVIGTTTFAPRHQKVALDIAAAGLIPMDRIVTHRFPLAEFKAGATLALEGKVLKAVFFPGRCAPRTTMIAEKV
jgi:L-iditol 2-dehydrogenase